MSYNYHEPDPYWEREHKLMNSMFLTCLSYVALIGAVIYVIATACH